MESTRATWNDRRMDEFAERTEQNFREVRADIRGTRAESRNELREEIKGLRTEMNERFAKLEGTFNRRFDILFGALATGFVAAVIQHFLG
jgi:hypothetical protein